MHKKKKKSEETLSCMNGSDDTVLGLIFIPLDRYCKELFFIFFKCGKTYIIGIKSTPKQGAGLPKQLLKDLCRRPRI